MKSGCDLDPLPFVVSGSLSEWRITASSCFSWDALYFYSYFHHWVHVIHLNYSHACNVQACSPTWSSTGRRMQLPSVLIYGCWNTDHVHQVCVNVQIPSPNQSIFLFLMTEWLQGTVHTNIQRRAISCPDGDRKQPWINSHRGLKWKASTSTDIYCTYCSRKVLGWAGTGTWATVV